MGLKRVKLLTQLVPIIYAKSKSHLTQLRPCFPSPADNRLTHTGSFCQEMASHAFVQMLICAAQVSSRCVFRSFEHPLCD